MKILQINKLYYPWIGGVETVVKQLAEGINNVDGFVMDVLVCNNAFKTIHERINGVFITRASSAGIFFSMPVSISFIAWLKKLWKGYDILHIHLPFPLVEIAIWLIRPKNRLIVTYHSDIVRQKFISLFVAGLDKWTLMRAEKIVVSNPNIIKNSAVLMHFKSKCEVIPFGADMDGFAIKEDKKRITSEIHKTFGEKIVLFVGRLVYYKGVEYLIRAMKNIDAKLLIVGEGPLKGTLAGEVHKNGLESRVTFIPYQKEDKLIDFYLSASVFVLPSIYRSEAFGITIIEAMACGLPVISTELGTGTSYVNEDGVTGFVVPPRDSYAISCAINKLLSDHALLSNMGEAAYRRVETLFTVEKMLNGYKKLYGADAV